MKKWIVLSIALVTGVLYYYYPLKHLPPGIKADRLVVFKKDHLLRVYSSGNMVVTYKVALGRHPVGPKRVQGDDRTPEGEYIIDSKNPNSQFHKNLGISYPNAWDKILAKQENTDPGGEIKIHGIRNGFGFIGKFHRLIDWTAGCIALTDDEVDELYDHVEVGTPILIRP